MSFYFRDCRSQVLINLLPGTPRNNLFLTANSKWFLRTATSTCQPHLSKGHSYVKAVTSTPKQVNWIGYNLKITQHRLRQRLDAELARLGITAAQNAVLLAVAGNPRMSNAELARAAFVTPQTMQAILVNLKRAGLIVRSPHPEHGRVIMTELTITGKKAVAKGAKAANAVERRMLSRLSPEEAQLLCELLKRCAAALDDESYD